MEGIVKERSSKMLPVSWLMLCAALTVLSVSLPLCAESVSLQALVTPSTTIVKDGRPLTFALHGFIEFKSIAEMFPYIDSQTQRWKGDANFDGPKRQLLARELLRRAIE